MMAGAWTLGPVRSFGLLKRLSGVVRGSGWRADMHRAVKYLDNSTAFWNNRTARLAPILTYLRETTAYLPHWQPYQNPLSALQLGIEHWKG